MTNKQTTDAEDFGSTAGLGLRAKQPSDQEDRAFWALLVIAQLWAATGHGWLAAPWLALCIWVRAPFWFNWWKKA